MNREILFRVIDAKTKDIVGYERINDMGQWEWIRPNREKWLLGSITDGLEYRKFIRLQFTGLLDKNGKKIWERDFVKVPDDFEKFGFMAGEKRSVYFIDGCFRLKPPKDTGGLGHALEDSMDECEVIGNIYDNAELLNDKK